MEPTVTDAQVVLGRLDPDMVLGGDLKLDAELAAEGDQEKIAKPLGMTVKDAALGIIKIINSNMALAIRSNSVARGIDPREFSIMPFGGAGTACTAWRSAEAVSARDVIVPVAPGITAAVGLLEDRPAVRVHRSRHRGAEQGGRTASSRRINAAVDTLTRAGHATELDNDGIPRAEQSLRAWSAECRYHGQGFELRARDARRARDAANKSR